MFNDVSSSTWSLQIYYVTPYCDASNTRSKIELNRTLLTYLNDDVLWFFLGYIFPTWIGDETPSASDCQVQVNATLAESQN